MGMIKLAAVMKEDLNSEDSIVIEAFGKILKGMFRVILFLGVPYLAYLLLLFGNQS